MSTDVKVSISQLPKTIHSGGFLGKMLGNLRKQILLGLAVPYVLLK